ncbi:adenylyltransferase/cytidyltransferase family protein [Candidatus Trichorickettsia mobilis]|uniref:adenylyltransferase/cytidyltransferase family protein n=1 Tax=Candidatus Trichorickettsia mobilis TaxID=1346319 RepID=UPI002931D6D8|nr:adenylyltransferase/cytidyltransferase family protein [Candidatus Trichorickettsia mobilis]
MKLQVIKNLKCLCYVGIFAFFTGCSHNPKTGCIFIGRFQPFHQEHLKILQNGLKNCQRTLVILGSANAPLSSKNPFTVHEREQMIRINLTEKENKRVFIAPVNDFKKDQEWLEAVKIEAKKYFGNSSITLLGCSKDQSSYYLHLFPNWALDLTTIENSINATDIRADLFINWNHCPLGLPDKIYQWLMENVTNNAYRLRYLSK